MLLTLTRVIQMPDCTIGDLSMGGRHLCWTLEDRVREISGVPVDQWKVPGETAIPFGEYRVLLTMSNRFKKVLPLLVDVPGFSGVRIHAGNTSEDTEGCILVGTYDQRLPKRVAQSRNTMIMLMDKLEAVIESGDGVWLRVQ